MRSVGSNLVQSTVYVIHRQVKNSRTVHSAESMCSVFISEQTATFVLCDKRISFHNGDKSVQYEVGSGSLNKTIYERPLNNEYYYSHGTVMMLIAPNENVVHFVSICVKNQQIQQLFIQFINYVR
jgi:hypothetical protein